MNDACLNDHRDTIIRGICDCACVLGNTLEVIRRGNPPEGALRLAMRQREALIRLAESLQSLSIGRSA